MKIKVVYHSSTGNTKKLAQAIASTLNVAAEPIAKDPVPFSSPVDLLFIGDGVYMGSINKRTKALIDKMDPRMVKNVAIFATYGNQAEIGFDMKRLLESKGLRVIGEPFTCKGQAWLFLNRNHPNNVDISGVREYAKNILEKVTKHLNYK